MQIGNDILIADAGGTSTRWCLVDCKGTICRDVHAAPINARLQNDLEINASLRSVDILLEAAKTVCFYGAGCAGPEESERMVKQFREIGFAGEVSIASDMTGAARALFGDNPGIACILGTGSNSAYFDGREIVDNVPPMGYILGDEGSGAAIGKRFLWHLLRGFLPEVEEMFFEETKLTVQDIYQKVYREPRANKFLGSLAEFVHWHLDEPRVRAIAQEEFDRFFIYCVERYDIPDGVPLGFIGSLAYYFADMLRYTARQRGFRLERIERSPIAGLIRYHLKDAAHKC